MFKYVLIFFGLAMLIALISTTILGFIGIKFGFLKLSILASSSILVAIIYFKKEKTIPTQKDSMKFIIYICIIFFIIVLANIYNKPTTQDTNYIIGHVTGSIIDVILAVYIPFFLTCKALSRNKN